MSKNKNKQSKKEKSQKRIKDVKNDKNNELKNRLNSKIIDGLNISISIEETSSLPFDSIIGNNINIQIGNKKILENADIKITPNNRYGLLGPNGSGKSTLLKSIYHKLIPSHKDLKIIQVEQTFLSSEKSVYQTVLEQNKELFELKLKVDELENKDMNDEELEEYNSLLDKLDDMDFSKNDSEIKKILHGLGFDNNQIELSTNSFSGGWQRRIALAKVLYLKSDLILLDEPTNHLDLEAVIWLSNYLSDYPKILIIVSHSSDFLDTVCNNTIFLINNKIRQYKGNYYRAKKLLLKDEEKLNKEYINLEKKLKEMSKKHKTKKEKEEYKKSLNLREKMTKYEVLYPKYQSLELSGNLIKMENMSFSYTDKPLLENINFTLPMGKRYTLVGKNGAGKSTFLKILNKELKPDNELLYHSVLRIGIYNQHFDTLLPNDETPVSYLLPLMTDSMSLCNDHTMSVRQYLGMIKLEGKAHYQNIGTLSGGQKARVAWLAMILKRPHLILLDEPTNHMDLEGIDGMIKSLELFNGSLIIITHDPTLITKLNTQLLVLEDNKIKEWKGDYEDYYEKIINE